jgi:hypothetical protein
LPLVGTQIPAILLTFKNRASYIQDGRTATLQMLHFIYFFSTNISTEYFKHATHSPFFSSKCRLFHNATFFGSCIIHISHTGVLKFKCKLRCQKVKFVSCILTDLHHHVCNCSHLNNVAFSLCRYVYDPSPYKILYVLKYFH